MDYTLDWKESYSPERLNVRSEGFKVDFRKPILEVGRRFAIGQDIVEHHA